MHLSSHPQVFVNVFAFIKSNVFLVYDDNFFHKKVFLFRKRFICWSFCHITMFWIYFCKVLMVSRCVTVPDCELLHFTPGLTALPLTLWWSMMMIMVVMMTTMVMNMMMVPSDPMTCARSGNVTLELIEPHIKPNRSWAYQPELKPTSRRKWWCQRPDKIKFPSSKSTNVTLRNIWLRPTISQDWDIDAADHVFPSRGYESGGLLRLRENFNLPWNPVLTGSEQRVVHNWAELGQYSCTMVLCAVVIQQRTAMSTYTTCIVRQFDNLHFQTDLSLCGFRSKC